ncbi:hypothetical protein IFR05_014854 [Cadophora sp. M221]|nr:hypothetical protein IFR05_014854 [Cadophora sp. M221]
MSSKQDTANTQQAEVLELDTSVYAALDNEQVGHIRHFHNLVAQKDGEWNHMGGEEPSQEYFTAYRYQLATMAYGIAVAHFHRQPALRSVYKPLFRRIIHKMLLNDVWTYWFLTSHGGKRTDPERTELRQPWADPVIHENIMYSGHLLLMTSLYGMLFDDDEFEKPGSIVFNWKPLFWGLGPETFTYDNRSLQEAILAEMERNNWIGVCCEPNMVFIVCNQFPLIAMRLNDVRDGTNKVDGVLDKYTAAWAKSSMVQSDGMFVDWFYLKQNSIFPPEGIPNSQFPARDLAFTAWAGAYMHSWNSELVESLYESQARGYISKADGHYRIRPTNVGFALRNLIINHNASPDSAEGLKQAIEDGKKYTPSPIPYNAPLYGIICQWLSELGKTEHLRDVLDYADTHLQPTWERGGLFYPRKDEQDPDSAEITCMEPFSGNTGIAYSRLNVPNGQKMIWEQPWTKKLLETRPWIDGITLDDGIDFLRGMWDDEKKALVLTVKTWDERQTILKPRGRNLRPGNWAVYFDQKLLKTAIVGEDGILEIKVVVTSRPVDVVLVQLE